MGYKLAKVRTGLFSGAAFYGLRCLFSALRAIIHDGWADPRGAQFNNDIEEFCTYFGKDNFHIERDENGEILLVFEVHYDTDMECGGFNTERVSLLRNLVNRYSRCPRLSKLLKSVDVNHLLDYLYLKADKNSRLDPKLFADIISSPRNPIEISCRQILANEVEKLKKLYDEKATLLQREEAKEHKDITMRTCELTESKPLAEVYRINAEMSKLHMSVIRAYQKKKDALITERRAETAALKKKFATL